jgi:hypothetical protein
LAAYSFKKEAKVYVVYSGNQYNIDISEINFSQSFATKNYSTKTLHQANAFESSVVYKAEPATFSIVFPALREDDLRVVFDRALDYQIFDLYVETAADVFKVENCIITNANFIVERLRPLSMAIAGEASQLTRAGDPGVFTIPGTVQPRSADRTYNRVTYSSVTLNGAVTLSDDLISLSIELQNNIKWANSAVVPEACGPATSVVYPSTFALENRILSGSVNRYLTQVNNAQLQTFEVDASLLIDVGQRVGGTTYGFNLNISNCIYTNRLNPGDVYNQSYDWRMTQNPTQLSDIVTYTTL